MQRDNYPREWSAPTAHGNGRLAPAPAPLASAPPLPEALCGLLIEALQGLPDGGDLQLRAHRESGRTTIEVQEGAGQSVTDASAQAFGALVAAASPNGTGTSGWSRVLAMLHQHQAEVSVGAVPGGGLLLRLSFAAPSAGLSSSPEAPLFGAETDRVSYAGRLRTLVVEDQDELRKTVASMLLQHEVVQERDLQTAASAEEALEMLMTQGPVELLITDLNLGPGMNGWQLVEQVHSRWPSTHVALATAWGAVIGEEEARLRGVEAVLSKPFRIAEVQRLTDAIRAAGR